MDRAGEPPDPPPGNGCISDVFHYEEGNSRIQGAVPGISPSWVDRENKVGRHLRRACRLPSAGPWWRAAGTPTSTWRASMSTCTSPGKGTTLGRDKDLLIRSPLAGPGTAAVQPERR